MNKKDFFEKIKGGLVVSCQALPEEPLFSSFIMGRMAVAAEEGGASGIRANTPDDIKEIKRMTDLPVIGLTKAVYSDSSVYITPTIKEIDELVESGADAIATDATDRTRPDGKSITEFFHEVRKKYPDMIFMADCAKDDDAIRAEKLGFDMAGTTLRGYTEETRGVSIPDMHMIKYLSKNLNIPLIAEGGIWEREQLAEVFENGAYAAVIGTAITRPRDITRRFVESIPRKLE
jgi:N-acylglucosamine-6-phosphate 2-epimerase